jgi:predicted metal-dependent hydrolase
LAPALGEQLRLFFTGPVAGEQSGPRQSEQLLQIGPHVLRYRLRRASQRRLSMTIDEHGLRVNANLSLPLAQIEAFIRQHAAWVMEKLAARENTPRPQRVVVTDGTRLPLLGGEAIVRVQPGSNRTRWIGDTLLLEARPAADLSVLARRGLQQRALAHFTQRLTHYAPQLNLNAPPLGLSSAKTRWGSCSTLSGIRINWRLIHLDAALGDYVVVHELAHLHEMNHSPRFWRHVERAYPAWRESREALKREAKTLPVV